MTEFSINILNFIFNVLLRRLKFRLGCNKAQLNAGAGLTLNNKDFFALFNKYHFFVNLLTEEDAISDDEDDNSNNYI